MSHNLPLPLSSFIGRAVELAEITALLGATRLLTLTGPGGSGKTRLALHLAHSLAARGVYPDLIAWVELADVAAADLVPPTVAGAVGASEQGGRPLVDSLVDSLRPRTALLVLDNCEHLRAACAALADTLLGACPRLTVLATSREPLNVAGEIAWPVPTLAVPADDGPADGVASYPAVQLFVARASASLPAFRLTDDNAPAVADICRRLDGLPLAIELAAAWIRALPVVDLAARLQDALGLLTRSSASAPARHQTLRAAIDWSYARLSPREQTLLNRLAVFAGGWRLEAAETVCAGPDLASGAILPTLADLVDKSLVARVAPQATDAQTARYRLLETIRQYAQAKLRASGDEKLVADRHLAWSLALAEAAVPAIKGPHSLAWLDRLDEEHDNLRAALRWSQTTGQVEAGLRLAAALHWFWDRRGLFTEGRAWLAALLQQAGGSPEDTGWRGARANALLGAAALAFDHGDWAGAGAYAAESADLFRALGDNVGLTLALLRLGFASGPGSERGQALLAEALALSHTLDDQWVVATTHYVVGQVAYFRADYTAARPLLEEALRRMREVGDNLFIPRILATLGGMDLGLGEFGQARARLEEGLALARLTGDPRALALVAGGLGDVARCQGDYGRAEEVYQESLALHQALNARADSPGIQHSLGYVALGQGDVERADALHRASLLAQCDLDNLPGVAEGLAGLGAVAVSRGQPERAARLFGAAEALRERVQPMVWPAERFEWERGVAALRARLDTAALTRAWAEGRAMTVEGAVGYALAAEDATPPTDTHDPTPRQAEKAVYGGLTAREREVAALVAQGHSNRAIADRLVIAERTAERHVANILSKLGFNTRAQIAAWAVEKGLTRRQ